MIARQANVMIVRQLHWTYWALLGMSLVLFVVAGLFGLQRPASRGRQAPERVLQHSGG